MPRLPGIRCLVIPEQFAEFTGAAAEIDPSPGGSFSLFDAMITGRTVELVPNRRLVQAWRVANRDEGVYSIVRLKLQESGTGDAMLDFHHTGYPKAHEVHLDSGWHTMYWEPIKAYLEQ